MPDQDMEFKTCINDLPEEVIVLIFKELQHKDVFDNCSNTCLKWREIGAQLLLDSFDTNTVR